MSKTKMELFIEIAKPNKMVFLNDFKRNLM